MISKKDLNTTKNRKIIYDYVKKYPGIHLNNLFRQLKMSENTVKHHLKYLISHNFVKCEKEKGYIRYYATYSLSKQHKNIISHLRIETSRNILLYLLICVCASQKELSNELHKADSTVNYHLKKLIDDGIVETACKEHNLIHTNYPILKHIKNEWDRREIIYLLVDPYLVYDVIISNKDKLFDNGDTKRFLKLFKESFDLKSKPTVGNTFDKKIDDFFNLFNSLFNPMYV